MSDEIRVYVDACCFIDMAKKAKGLLLTKQKEDDVWFITKLLEAAKDGKIRAYTSAFTMVECIGVRATEGKNSEMIVDDEIKRLFKSILASGRSGIIPVQPDYFVNQTARDLYWKSNITCKPADRLHLATAISVACSEFITIDGRIGTTHRTEIKKKFDMNICSPINTKCLPDGYRQLDIAERDGPEQQ